MRRAAGVLWGRFFGGALFGGILLVLAARPALADRIDGAWCRESGAHLSIDGPRIVSPGGTPTEGAYARHYFSFVVPPGEPDAGATMEMRLLNEETMQSRLGPTAPVLTWHRCGPDVS